MTRGGALDHRPACRWPGCERRASQASWGCRHHYFRLPPDFRRGLWHADREERKANGRLGQAWYAVAAAAEQWIAELLAKQAGPKSRRWTPQRELDL
jgi:hypothetical protein